MIRKPLPFMRFYFDDYLADTTHLSCLEHGAYFLIIANYWQRQKPPLEERLPSISRLTNDQFSAMRDVLAEFFEIENRVWKHGRIELELQRIRDESKRNRRAGKASAKARKLRAKNEADLTPVQRTLNERNQSVEQIIRSNELSAVPLAKTRISRKENELMEARARVWKIENEIRQSEDELAQQNGGEK